MRRRLKDRVEGEANRVLRERVSSLRRELDRVLGALAEPLEFPLTPGEWGAAGGDEQLRTLRDAIDGMARGDRQHDILTVLLDAAAAFYPRAALFIVKDGAFTGWAGLGFLGEGGFASEAIRGVSLSAGEDHLLGHAARSRSAQRSGPEGPGDRIVTALGRVRPADACAVPVLVRGRPVAVLYGDSGSGAEAGNPLAMEIAARIAGMAMERLAAARRGHEAAHDAGPAVRPAGVVTPPEEAEVRALLADLDGQPRRPGSDVGLPDEERRRQADARRFARLLVSELLLYNEAAVIQGRRHQDLYARLGKEIERSRQAYRARFATRPGATDYFEQELVRVLAEGNPALLGT
jgi:hypothetical protein